MSGSNEVVLSLAVRAGVRVAVVRGDLTLEAVDALVNAANEQLLHGGGVAGAIARRGGPAIQLESLGWVMAHGRVKTGSAAITGGGKLVARYVIHAVGPVWHNRGDEPGLLRSAVQAALALAEEKGLHSISIPALSTGIFGFPKALAAEVIWQAVLDYLTEHPESTLQEIRLCAIDAPTVEVLRAEGDRRFHHSATEDTEKK